ncbi:MAG: phosphotransferase [Propionibacteriaceae bacterium]|nr:phosphotransferase [Propionibacteriaceae bacterium]
MASPRIDAWRHYLPHARWFQNKGQDLTTIALEPLSWLTTGGHALVRSELAHVGVGDVEEVYHLLVGYLPVGHGEPSALIGQVDLPDVGLVDMVDAPRSPQAMRALLGALSDPATPGMAWRHTPPDPDCNTEVFSGEQSNTTVRLGDTALLKIFRRLTPGRNREIEVLSALDSCSITPRLIGTWSTPDSRYDLGLVVARVADAHDGWAFATEAAHSGQSITDEMTALGAALLNLHSSLASAFPTSWIDADLCRIRMLYRLDRACAQVPRLREARGALTAILSRPHGLVPVQTVHGDFHLGQALISPAGWRIIDFEGEPLTSDEDPTAPDSVWRDVAGLLRSLEYAWSTHPDPTSDQARRWLLDARRAFLSGYGTDTVVPSDLLRAYEVDKTIYEVMYETRNRPEWTWIPWQAIDAAIAS